MRSSLASLAAPSIAVLSLAAWASPARSQDVVRLSLRDAEQRALANHPQIRAGQYLALAAGEETRQARSVYLPTVYGNVTGVTAPHDTRIAAGELNVPSVFERAAAGLALTQFVTDFGHTGDVVQSRTLQADALGQDAVTRRAEVLLQVDTAYFIALRAQAVLAVARQTVEARQLVVDQVSALASSGLRSSLDLSFARVNLSQAQLLFAQAQGDLQGSFAGLTAAIGSSQPASYQLIDEPMPAPPTDEGPVLVARALRDRPDVAATRLSEQSAAKFAEAERTLWWPSIVIGGAAGVSPYHEAGLNDHYATIGINMTVPIANGGLYSARHAEAALRDLAERHTLFDLENRVARDVTVAWLDVKTAFQRVDLTNQLLAQAADSLELAQARYNLGLSSIVELSQAQLNKTQAEIDQASARYDYQTRLAALRFQTGALK
jgi:outer membrane protein